MHFSSCFDDLIALLTTGGSSTRRYSLPKGESPRRNHLTFVWHLFAGCNGIAPGAASALTESADAAAAYVRAPANHASLTINCEQIERLEVWPLAAEQQVLEIAAAAPIEADDLAIDYGVLRLDWVRTIFTQLRPLLEGVAVTRPQLGVMPIDVRQSAKPVVLHIEEPVRGDRNGWGAILSTC